MSEVILVDSNDNIIRTEEKIKAHEQCLLHRAFSIFIFNDNKELMLQQRAFSKYHSGGLWTNSCCGHPELNKDILFYAQKRLKEEMGFSCDLEFKDKFIYKAKLDNNLFEHELDYIFVGHYNFDPKINIEEACAFSWQNLESIKKDIKVNPEKYTVWFKVILEKDKIICRY